MKKIPPEVTHILFDVDGTLYDKTQEYHPGKGTIEDAHEFFRYKTFQLATSGKTLDEVAEEVVTKYKGCTDIKGALANMPRDLKEKYHTLVKKHGSNGRVFVNEFGAQNDYFASILSNIDFGAILAPDQELQKIIKQLKEKFTLGIISNEVFSTVKTAIATLGLDLEDFAMNTESAYPVFCRENGVDKPDRVVFEKALEVNKINPKKVAYVGDSISKDMVPAKKAGLITIHFSKEPINHPSIDYSVQNIQELLAILN